MAKDLAIVLNSGSLNSAVLTALAAQKYRPVMLYAEITGGTGRAKAAYDLQVQHFRPYREHAVPMPYLSAVAATKQNIVPAVDPRVSVSVAPLLMDMVPLLAAAARFAAFYGSSAIYLGLRVGAGTDELAQATEFGQVWNELLQVPCAMPELTVEMPLLELDPWQVVDVGYQVGAPFERTWSCLEETPEPCWACRGCKTREAAFEQAAKPDPLRAIRKV
jgi:7-cyano-7-deazaguanine synthase